MGGERVNIVDQLQEEEVEFPPISMQMEPLILVIAARNNTQLAHLEETTSPNSLLIRTRESSDRLWVPKKQRGDQGRRGQGVEGRTMSFGCNADAVATASSKQGAGSPPQVGPTQLHKLPNTWRSLNWRSN